MDGDANIVREALELALGISTESSESTLRAITSINSALPALPTTLLQRILAEYIDFSELSPVKGKPRSLPHYLQDHVLLLQIQLGVR